MVSEKQIRTRSKELNQRASLSIPGSVDSPVRAFKAVGGNPVFINRAEGCTAWDCDGNRLVDYIGSWGPMIAGHAHPDVVEAIQKAAESGTSFGVSCPQEIELAEEVKRRMPSIEMIRFVNSGTEAAMSAIRLARAHTRRNKIIKFSGCYHGHADQFLVSAGSGVATFALPNSPGVTPGAIVDTLTAEYNNLNSVGMQFDEYPGDIAAVIVEPVAGNMGVIPPEDGFLEELRGMCTSNGALLIFDEVMTGFRIAQGGAQAKYGITPDITLLGKIIGGGLPVGAFGGSSEIMKQLAPEGDVYQAGTLSGNPLAMAAGLATLKLMNEKAYRALEQNSKLFQDGLTRQLQASGIPGCVQRVGSMLTLFFSRERVENFNDALVADHDLFGVFFRGMLENGILLPPSGYESWFVSTVHDRETILATVEAAKSVLTGMSR